MCDGRVQIHLRQFDNTKYSAQEMSESGPSTGSQPTAETCLDDAPAATAAAMAGSVVLC